MNEQDLVIEKWTSKQYPNLPYINFFVSKNNEGEYDFVGEIIYNHVWVGVIKIIRLHTANLVKNTLVNPIRFRNAWLRKYPWLWILCLSRFIQEVRKDLKPKKLYYFQYLMLSDFIGKQQLDYWRLEKLLAGNNEMDYFQWIGFLFGLSNSFEIFLTCILN